LTVYSMVRVYPWLEEDFGHPGGIHEQAKEIARLYSGQLRNEDVPVDKRAGYAADLMDVYQVYSDLGYLKNGVDVAYEILSARENGKIMLPCRTPNVCRLLCNCYYFARDEKRIYAYGKQLPKAELTSWELLGHWYSRDARRVYYLNREIKGADRDSFTVCTPLDAPPLADHLARDKDHYYQNDEMMEEPLWLESLHELIQKP